MPGNIADQTTTNASQRSGVCCQNNFCIKPAFIRATAASYWVWLAFVLFPVLSNGLEFGPVISNTSIAFNTCETATDRPATSSTGRDGWPAVLWLHDWLRLTTNVLICRELALGNCRWRCANTVSTSHRAMNMDGHPKPLCGPCGSPFDLAIALLLSTRLLAIELLTTSNKFITPAEESIPNFFNCTFVARLAYSNVAGPNVADVAEIGLPWNVTPKSARAKRTWIPKFKAL